MAIVKGQIGNALESVAPDHILGVANDIYDEKLEDYQSDINFYLKRNIPYALGYDENNGEVYGMFYEGNTILTAELTEDGYIYLYTEDMGVTDNGELWEDI